ncbi:PREDICTED: MATH domain and coiled-coil domain-containing protein At3g58210-like [Erythranthe guttata]|uniref:MATH domain and coiled-coil domain-containing protein At3g58210-like n=1 Tax=Erythranthe guttata TaxID=4155 RepID=UPI00064DDC11|nr:PREDICTED: MATH domain and coiled-coil domain-containing protein At3g58210-like [Erythranthe guttata]|eukprot:XP_012833083.1 PREDICTED: MATH domain and coiled-coil domain-containing protein At3g58210-like [Erythranthe guttata]
MDSVKLAADDETTRMETRDAPPTHFLIKIESFSLLESNIEFDKYVTKEFKAGKYKWRLIIYPNGEDNGGDNDHVSVNLAMVATSSMPANWEINVMFNIFILNHNSGNYLCSGIIFSSCMCIIFHTIHYSFHLSSLHQLHI